ncbi:alpha/beta fold hydrolase [Bacillus inaquosorum]|uniref:alpha/beta fold hydrolase n=1 Tax=Bacillus inaquosorum TaxID=483913 RepID=UPI00227ECC7A|nr:alpha/beta hydrolase [Bacillus inaquosorum]MCY8278916.1 alpha/beta hydrolase [Bacillus inaquosorum]MCY8751939.1 alpha/beta hydrolase [Bacillus inaquosorum]MCY9342988.1 alpha/beta hydrolase [Bacillus inaquosorum]MCY9409922.1 alpha/beta hydrolase [Bacillus inaquosorum]MCY9417438.1 alpha/beta hydrolase [Bacillus inaquosorum]
MERTGICHSDGFDLSYRIEGEGAPILVIGSAVYYPRLFSEHIKQKYQWIFVDHRGFAKPKRELRTEDLSLDAVLADIERMRTSLQLEDVVILGHSGHAFMALEYARTYPEHVRKVALFNTAPDNSEERQRKSETFFMETASLERKKRFEKDIANLPRDIEIDPERRFVHMCIRAEAKSFYQERPHAAALWDGVFTNMPIIDELWGHTFAQLDLIKRLADVQVPVYIGLGRYDYLVAPVTLWDAVEGSYPHVEKVIFEKSGHQPMLEEPQAFDQSFSKWMDK